MKNDPLIRVTGLEASFVQHEETTPVLHDLDFELAPGETLGIVGESGSGKSVTSMSILRLIPSPPIRYDAGSIHYEPLTIDLLRADEKQMRALRGKEISMVFQEPMTSLNPLRTCGSQLMEVLKTHSAGTRPERKAKVLDLFSEVELPDPSRAFNAYPHELSGGQKQRVMIAMAISCSPRLLIADEPTTALDVTVQRNILELLKGLQARVGMAMILISHDLAVVSSVSDRLLVMHKGRIVEQGVTKEVIGHPSHPYTRALLSSRPPQSGRPIKLLTVSDHLGAEGSPAIQWEKPEERRSRHKAIYAKDPILEAKGLFTWYPIRTGVLQRVSDHVKALNNVSLVLYAGETLGVVGESGCGKSTLGRTLMGLETAREGIIRYKGRDLSQMDKEQYREMRTQVQMIFQDPYSSLDPRQQIGKAIQEPMMIHGLHGNDKSRKEAVLDLLKEVGLEEAHYSRYPHEFSGGQRQRICIARALAMDPQVLICDESVSALDVSVQAQVLNLLNTLQDQRGLSYLFISHDLSVVRYFSDRVMVMEQGECVESGESDRVYDAPENDYTRKLVGSTYSISE